MEAATFDLRLLQGIKQHTIVSFLSGITLLVGVVCGVLWWGAPMPGPITTPVQSFPNSHVVYHLTFNPRAIAPQVSMAEFTRDAVGKDVTISIWQGWLTPGDRTIWSDSTPEQQRDTIWYLVERNGVLIATSETIGVQNTPFTYHHSVRFDAVGRVFVSEISWAILDGFFISFLLCAIGIGGFTAVYLQRDAYWGCF
jgi:hypothetical protein